MTPDKEQTMGEERELADVVEWAAMEATEQADEYERKADRAAEKHNHTFALTWQASERILRENASMLNDLARRLRRGGGVGGEERDWQAEYEAWHSIARDMTFTLVEAMPDYTYDGYERKLAEEAARRLRSTPDDGSEGREPVAYSFEVRVNGEWDIAHLRSKGDAHPEDVENWADWGREHPRRVRPLYAPKEEGEDE